MEKYSFGFIPSDTFWPGSVYILSNMFQLRSGFILSMFRLWFCSNRHLFSMFHCTASPHNLTQLRILVLLSFPPSERKAGLQLPHRVILISNKSRSSYCHFCLVLLFFSLPCLLHLPVDTADPRYSK